MTTPLASTLVAVDEANKIEAAIAKIKAETTEDYTRRIELVTFAIKHMEPMFERPATEENILEATKLIINAKITLDLTPKTSDSLIEAIISGGAIGGLTSGVDMLSKFTKGGGVEGMIERFGLNARASLEARSGTLTIGKLLEIQPSVFIKF